jgi:hypothetical protein
VLEQCCVMSSSKRVGLLSILLCSNNQSLYVVQLVFVLYSATGRLDVF